LENRFLRLIEVLTRHDVRFVVVGGVAAVLQRVPINTQDFDLVHDPAKDNVARLLLALDEHVGRRVFSRRRLPAARRVVAAGRPEIRGHSRAGRRHSLRALAFKHLSVGSPHLDPANLNLPWTKSVQDVRLVSHGGLGDLFEEFGLGLPVLAEVI